MDLTIGYFLTSLYGISKSIRFAIDLRTANSYKPKTKWFYIFAIITSMSLAACGWFLGMSTGDYPIVDRATLVIGMRISFMLFSSAGVLKESAYWLDRFVIK